MKKILFILLFILIMAASSSGSGNAEITDGRVVIMTPDASLKMQLYRDGLDAYIDWTTGTLYMEGGDIAFDNQSRGNSRFFWDDANSTLIVYIIDTNQVETNDVNAVTGTFSGLVTIDTLNLTNALTVPYGGTGATSLTDGGIILGSGVGTVTVLGVAANGQIPIGDGTTDPQLNTITGTVDRVTVSNAAGSITLSLPQDYDTGATPTLGGGTYTGTVTGVTPTSSAHLTTKEYVDTAVAGLHFDMFLDNLDSTINDPVTIEDYYSLQTTETGDSVSTLPAYAALGQGDDQEVLSYISGASLPFAELQAGLIQVHIHARKDNTGQKDTVLFGKLYHRASGGTEILIATTEDSDDLTNAFTGYNLHGTIANTVAFGATDRLLLKIRADVQAAGGGNAQIEVRQEGDEASRVSALVETDTLSDIFVRQDGTTPLTANWDVGIFSLTMENLTLGGTIFADDLVFTVAGDIDMDGVDVINLTSAVISLVTDGTDIVLNANDDVRITAADELKFISSGQFTVSGSSSALIHSAGTINFQSSGDTGDYIRFQTAGDVPEITTVGSCNLKLNSSGSVEVASGWTAAGQTCADLGTVTTADIDGGTIDGVALGATCTQTEWDAANAHISATGASHSYIDQSVVVASTPQFASLGIGTVATSTEGIKLAKSPTATFTGAESTITATPGSAGQNYKALNFSTFLGTSTEDILTAMGCAGIVGRTVGPGGYAGTVTLAAPYQASLSIGGSTPPGDPTVVTTAALFYGTGFTEDLFCAFGTSYGLRLPPISSSGTDYAIYTVGSDSNSYFEGDISADDVTDRTLGWEGTSKVALDSLLLVKSKDGKIDHSTLPDFAKRTVTEQRPTGEVTMLDGFEIPVTESVEIPARSLGAMITLLTEAVKELKAENETLKARVEKLEGP